MSDIDTSVDNPHDCIHRFLFDNTDIRGEIVTLENSYREALAAQNIPTCVHRLLGEFFAGVTLLSEILKFEGLLTLQVRGDGLLPLIMTEADHQGHIRGIAKLAEGADNDETIAEIADAVDHGDLPTLVGNGVLTITIDPKRGERYQGIVPLEQATLAACLSGYFSQSEQLPTWIQLYADNERCGGLFLQCLPPQKVIDTESRADLWQTATQLAATLEANEMLANDHPTVLYRLFNDFNCRVFPPKDVTFRCSCSRERSAVALTSLGKEDAYALLAERDIISTQCEFCGSEYTFGKDDLETLFGANDETLH